MMRFRRMLRSSRRSLGVRLGVASVALALSAGCSSPGEPQPSIPVTGRWLGPVWVDVWSEFRLQQDGAAVSGTYGTGTANGDRQFFQIASVTGHAYPPFVVLQWSESDGRGGTNNMTMIATVSANGDTLTGKLSANGQSPTTVAPYVRVALPVN